MTDNKKWLVCIHYITVSLRWCLFSIATGLLCGLVGTGLSYMIVGANALRSEHNNIIWFLPIAGLLIVKIYHMLDIPEDKGPDLIFDSIREQNHIPLQVTITSAVSTVITHLFGGSAGRVGAALQIGGGLSSGMSKHFKLNPKDRSLFIMCGMCGLVTVLFGTPLAATFLAMEVISVGVIYYAALLPCLVTSITAFFVAQFFDLTQMQYILENIPKISAIPLLKVGLFATACAIVSILFCSSIKELNVVIKNKIPNPYIRVVIGAFAIIGLTLLIGEQTYNGSGNDLLNHALVEGSAKPWDFALKLLFTAITLSCGFKGGGVFPAFIVGGTFGACFGPYFGLNPQFAAAIGLISVFCGAVNCPIASILLGAEIFGGAGVIYFAIASAISFVFSGYFTLFPGQDFIYSKLRIEYRSSNLRRREPEE
ncbi:MAG: chloride channel protein [Lachnospiraceae bacterium]|nr:chloride channel protein [Lachnospiraceae bacterium]